MEFIVIFSCLVYFQYLFIVICIVFGFLSLHVCNSFGNFIVGIHTNCPPLCTIFSYLSSLFLWDWSGRIHLYCEDSYIVMRSTGHQIHYKKKFAKITFWELLGVLSWKITQVPINSLFHKRKKREDFVDIHTGKISWWLFWLVSLWYPWEKVIRRRGNGTRNGQWLLWG